MEYYILIDKIDSRISNIILSKEEEKSQYDPQYIELYGDSKVEQIIALEPFYLNKWRETVNQLRGIRLQYNSNKDFYVAVSKLFAQTYIPLIIQEYGITNQELVAKLLNIAIGNVSRV